MSKDLIILDERVDTDLHCFNCGDCMIVIEDDIAAATCLSCGKSIRVIYRDSPIKIGKRCPECGAPLQHVESCAVCAACGYSVCG